MREYENEASHRNGQRPGYVHDRIGGNRISNSNQSIQYRPVDRVYSTDGNAGNSWVDNDSAWFTYRLATTYLCLGLFGIGIGQCLVKMLGV